MYSQNNEEQIIFDFFRETKGSFLDIGAYDGIHLSNTYALAERGWDGVCIEASPTVYQKLIETHSDHPNVLCLNIAIAGHDGAIMFYDNPNAVATAVKKETERWKDEAFNEITVQCATFQTMKDIHGWKSFDFISIDAEGMDYLILQQIDLNDLKTKMICIEWNGKDFDMYNGYITGFGFTLKTHNAENLLYIKP